MSDSYSSDLIYTGAPDECSRCWPHKWYDGPCDPGLLTPGCPACKQEAEYLLDLSAWERSPDFIEGRLE